MEAVRYQGITRRTDITERGHTSLDLETLGELLECKAAIFPSD